MWLTSGSAKVVLYIYLKCSKKEKLKSEGESEAVADKTLTNIQLEL